jgi:hypothetical protein
MESFFRGAGVIFLNKEGGFPKTSVFEKASLDLGEKVGCRPLFP